MTEILKKAFCIIKEKAAISSIFIFLIIILQLFSLFMIEKQTATLNFFISFVVLLLMTVAFFAGWFNVIKEAVLDNKEISDVESFFSGIGEKFLMISKISFFYSVFFIIISLLAYKGLCTFFPSLHFSRSDVVEVFNEINNLQNATAFPVLNNKVIIFFMLGACFNIAFYIWLYIMAFFVADIYINNQKNFFKNFIYSVKFIFINIKQIILAFLFLAFLFIIVYIFSVIGAANIVLGIISIFLFGYYASFCYVVVFLLYERNRDKSNCDNRCDSNR